MNISKRFKYLKFLICEMLLNSITGKWRGTYSKIPKLYKTWVEIEIYLENIDLKNSQELK